jgi:transcriptional antiterminator NusG
VSNTEAVSHEPWYALYVKTHHEKSITLSLTAKSYECFLPTYLNVRQDSKKYELPLFPNYVFCRLEISKPLPVLSTPGVFSIVNSGRTPAPVPASEIDRIRRLLESGCMLRPWPYLAPGNEIRVTSGPLHGVQGVVLDDKHNKWIVISIDLLQRSIAAKVDRAYFTDLGPSAHILSGPRD